MGGHAGREEWMGEQATHRQDGQAGREGWTGRMLVEVGDGHREAGAGRTRREAGRGQGEDGQRDQARDWWDTGSSRQGRGWTSLVGRWGADRDR